MYLIRCKTSKAYNAGAVQSSIIDNFLIGIGEKLSKSQMAAVKLSLIRKQEICISCLDNIQADYLYKKFNSLNSDKSWNFEIIDLDEGIF